VRAGLTFFSFLSSVHKVTIDEGCFVPFGGSFFSNLEVGGFFCLPGDWKAYQLPPFLLLGFLLMFAVSLLFCAFFSSQVLQYQNPFCRNWSSFSVRFWLRRFKVFSPSLFFECFSL